MTKTFKAKAARLLLGSAAALALAAPAQATETLRAVAAFPASLAFTKSFQGFVDLVNEKGKDVVQIQVLGGPEVFPPNQQIDAVKRGVVDMQYGPATYYLGTLPEAYAWVGSTVSAAEARENGGFAVMQEAFSEKMGVKLLAQIDTGIEFHIYTTEEPEIADDGSVNLDGKKLRALPIYNKFFEALGAVPVSVPVPDVYTGLERHTFDGAGWPVVAIQDLSWDKFLRFRIDPGFFQTDLGIVMNQDAWDGLSDEAKALLEETAAEYEQISHDNFQQVIAETDAAVRGDGMEVVTLEGEAADAYLDKAFGSSWEALEASGSAYHDKLKAAYYSR